MAYQQQGQAYGGSPYGQQAPQMGNAYPQYEVQMQPIGYGQQPTNPIAPQGTAYPQFTPQNYAQMQPVNYGSPQNYPPQNNVYGGQPGDPYGQANNPYGQPLVGMPVYPAEVLSQQQNQGKIVIVGAGGYQNNGAVLPSNCDNVPYPSQIRCPYCNSNVCTVVQSTPGTGTWACCCLWLILFWPCAWLPFVIDDCKDQIHLCPNCGNIVGRKTFCC